MILDWKRTNSIVFHKVFRSLREPLRHLPLSNGWLYCLQLNVHKYMLETEYGLKASSMYLGQVHPCLPRARLIEVPCMRDELQLIVEDQIDLGEAISGGLPDARFKLPEQKRAVRTELVHVCVGSTYLQVFYLLLALPCLSSTYLLLCPRARLEMKGTSGDVVLIERLTYPVWRLLIELLWGDFSFSYFCLPKFNNDGSITLLVLGNGGPTRYKTPTPHPLPAGGACGEARPGARHGGQAEALAERRELRRRGIAQLGLRDNGRQGLADSPLLEVL